MTNVLLQTKVDQLQAAFVHVDRQKDKRPSGYRGIQTSTTELLKLVVVTVQTKAAHTVQTAANLQAGLHQDLIRGLQTL